MNEQDQHALALAHLIIALAGVAIIAAGGAWFASIVIDTAIYMLGVK